MASIELHGVYRLVAVARLIRAAPRTRTAVRATTEAISVPTVIVRVSVLGG
jgi:hypothetical protein